MYAAKFGINECNLRLEHEDLDVKKMGLGPRLL